MGDFGHAKSSGFRFKHEVDPPGQDFDRRSLGKALASRPQFLVPDVHAGHRRSRSLRYGREQAVPWIAKMPRRHVIREEALMRGAAPRTRS